MPATVAEMPSDLSSAVEIAQADGPDVLRRIKEPDIALALWRRRLSPATEAWLNRLSADEMPQGRVLAHRSEFGPALREFISAPGGASLEETRFLADVAELSTRFAEVAGTDVVDINLKAIQHDACWKFHRDHVALRLVTTYRGPGTQFVGSHLATRALDEQIDFAGEIQEIPEQTVAVFRGAIDTLGRGVVHRSPPISGSGLTRLVLVLNLPSESSPKHQMRHERQQDTSFR